MSIDHIISTSSGPGSIKPGTGKKTNPQPRKPVIIKQDSKQESIENLFKEILNTAQEEQKKEHQNPAKNYDKTVIEYGLDNNTVKILIFDADSVLTVYGLQNKTHHEINGPWEFNKKMVIGRLKSNIRDITPKDVVTVEKDGNTYGALITLNSDNPNRLLSRIKIAFTQYYGRLPGGNMDNSLKVI